MILSIFFLFTSISASIGLYLGLQLYNDWYYVFILIFSVPIFYVFSFVLYILMLFFISLFLSKKRKIAKPNLFLINIIKKTSYQLLFFSNTKVHVKGLEKLPQKPYLIVSNHTSMFDPIVILSKVKTKSIVCISKPENFNIPICGPFIHNAGFIPISRENNIKAMSSIVQAIKDIVDYNTSVYICPEGTRSKTGEMASFHPGSFKIATKSGADLVIAKIEGTNKIHKNFPFKRNHVYFEILEVITEEQYQKYNTLELAAMAEQMIKNSLN